MNNIGKILVSLVILSVIIIPTGHYLTLNRDEAVMADCIIGLNCSGDISTSSLFYLNVTLEPHVPCAGVQFSIKYTPELTDIMVILPGELFPPGNSYINYGDIDKANGFIEDIALVCLNRTIDYNGTIAYLVFVIKEPGEISFTISDVIIGDAGGMELDTVIKNKTIILEVG